MTIVPDKARIPVPRAPYVIPANVRASVLDLVCKAHDATKDSYEVEIAVISAHLAALETYLFPAACANLDDGREAVRPLRAQVHLIERLTRQLEGRLRGSTQHVAKSINDVHDVVRREFAALEDGEWVLASRLDAELTERRRTRLLDSLESASHRSPTRPHPYTPHSRGLARLMFRVCAAWDSAMDTMDGRVVPAQRAVKRLRPAGRWGMFMTGASSFEPGKDQVGE